MPVTGPNIIYSGSTAYTLAKVGSYEVDPYDATSVSVRFVDSPNSRVRFTKAAFEAAYQAALDYYATFVTSDDYRIVRGGDTRIVRGGDLRTVR